MPENSFPEKAIFINEMPWLDTLRSNFVIALENFWNRWEYSVRYRPDKYLKAYFMSKYRNFATISLIIIRTMEFYLYLCKVQR